VRIIIGIAQFMIWYWKIVPTFIISHVETSIGAMVINLYVILRFYIQTVDWAIYVRLVHKSAIYIIYNDQRIINPEYICLITRQFWDFTAKQFIINQTLSSTKTLETDIYIIKILYVYINNTLHIYLVY
jgi:hypothetical protein